MSIIERNNVRVHGNSKHAMVFAHGFGCDQNMWRYVAPVFEADFKTVLFDSVGAGGSDLSAYSREKYGSLRGYAEDLLEICDELELMNITFVGHSVAAMVGVLAATQQPERFERLVLVGPSPRYIDDEGYRGGFASNEIEELLQFLDSNHMGWSAAMAPAIMGNPDRPELSEELKNSFCRTDPEIAKHFARVTFTADNRNDLSNVRIPTLILQCSEDVIAPIEVGRYVHAQIRNSELVILRATGHCPNLSAPLETIDAIRSFIRN